MSEVSIIGLDIAKHVFQAHGVDASGHVLLRKKISRAKLLPFFAAQPHCQVVLEGIVRPNALLVRPAGVEAVPCLASANPPRPFATLIPHPR